jgi:hypothetical protein
MPSSASIPTAPWQGMPLLSDAPVYTSDVPEVDYEDFWVTPEKIVFVGLNVPSSSYRLVMKMSRTESTGVSSGWGNTVIVAPAFSPDWGDADITEGYLSTIGFLPVAGQKYFLSFWWLLRPCLFPLTQLAEYQSSVRFLCFTKIGRGTKTGQNHGKIKARTLVLEMPFLASLCIGCKGTILSPNKRMNLHKSFFTNHIFNLSRHKRIMQHFWQYSPCEPIPSVKVC